MNNVLIINIKFILGGGTEIQFVECFSKLQINISTLVRSYGSFQIYVITFIAIAEYFRQNYSQRTFS